MSGDYDNDWKNSNGAWIRTEIWATTAPGLPHIAARHAMEDAKVDHGAGEGTAAAAFVAAMQSAAYAGGSIRDIIDTALVYVPQDSRVAKTVRFVIGCYEGGMGEKECRDAIVELNSDIGHGWFQAPSNIGFVILGLLYGEGDFKKSMIKAINCGDDTDCTAATLGATLGILYGGAGIPEDWRSYIGDSIKTISIAEGCVTDRRVRIPKTCTDLTDMVMNMAPIALADVNADVRICDDECEIPENIHEIFRSDKKTALAIAAMKPYSFKTDLLLATATVTFDRQNDISAGESIGLTVYIDNNYDAYGNGPMNLSFRWILPEGFTVSASPSIRLDHATSLTNHIAQYRAEITATENVKSANRIVLEVEFEGRAEVGYIPIVLVGK